jgi:hypothetical protein
MNTLYDENREVMKQLNQTQQAKERFFQSYDMNMMLQDQGKL